MAGDAFTQIRNDLFRDRRLSAKAKGIFGFISTHRDGWGVTPESIAASMTDGTSAIKTGLRELEAFGYLLREQPRRPDGTMGPIEYFITDQPSSAPVVENHPPGVSREDGRFRRSGPVDENPPAADPPAVDRTLKNTSTKKTREENTTVPPPGTGEPSASPGGGGRDSGGVVELAMPPGGLAVLLEVFRREPRLAFSGDALLHQALAVEGRLALGWSPKDLVLLLAAEPMAGMRTAAGTLAKRIAKLPAAPPSVPRPGGTEAPPAPAARPVWEAHAAPPPSCATCAGYPAPGEDQCPACLGWPLCDSRCGRRTPEGGACEECGRAALEAALAAPATADGCCPCGRPAVTLGWCSRCRIAKEAGRRAVC